MAKYAPNEPGVASLRGMSAALSESSENIKKLVDTLETVVEEHANTLGPHQSSIASVIEEVRAAQSAATEPVQGVSKALDDVADAYQDIIDDDRLSGILGN